VDAARQDATHRAFQPALELSVARQSRQTGPYCSLTRLLHLPQSSLFNPTLLFAMTVPFWSLGLEESRASLGTLLVLLGGGTACSYRSYKRIALDDRHSTPCGQHPPA
jgi:hypothetical protein